MSEILRNILNMKNKLINKDEIISEPSELVNLSPSELSFWFASLFSDSLLEQQKVF